MVVSLLTTFQSRKRKKGGGGKERNNKNGRQPHPSANDVVSALKHDLRDPLLQVANAGRGVLPDLNGRAPEGAEGFQIFLF